MKNQMGIEMGMAAPGTIPSGAQQGQEQEYNQLLHEMRLFFGPSRQFKKIFLRALLLSNQHKYHYDPKTGKAVDVDGAEAKAKGYKTGVFQLDEEPIFK